MDRMQDLTTIEQNKDDHDDDTTMPALETVQNDVAPEMPQETETTEENENKMDLQPNASASDASNETTILQRCRRTHTPSLLQDCEDALRNVSTTKAVLASLGTLLLVSYEYDKQQRWSMPPLVFGHAQSEPMKLIYDALTKTPTSPLRRVMTPKFMIGTNTLASSTAAYLKLKPRKKSQYLQFREVLTMPLDGASILLDWELPLPTSEEATTLTPDARIHQIRHGPIHQPLIFILHGLNNHSDFGYVKSLMRTFVRRGWVAVGMNQRGLQGAPLTTPRASNGAYTGDVRYTLLQLMRRLAPNVPMILIGASLGGNTIANYLGEEGLSNTLPSCIVGAVTLGNTVSVDALANNKVLQGTANIGFRKQLLDQIKGHFHKLGTHALRKAHLDALLVNNQKDFDDTLAPFMIANDKVYPFGIRIGYKSGADYRKHANSYPLLPFISVPTLQAYAGDDLFVAEPIRAKLSYALANPNILTVETKCGGHLGWQEAGSYISVGPNWADGVTADFIQAVLETRQARKSQSDNDDWKANALFAREVAKQELERIRSRL
jgi:uncharacterized protein